ncbi:Zinc transporter 1-like 1 [Homarus americanus]|uniref:Zinc transporter 1-like 1 n=1 Tax=Homarus americanus TaxID=6706 RepID=A0A8J5K4W8_HOMAM|nr:Zinc transporter 1-like 1 [Homarus americanus]
MFSMTASFFLVELIVGYITNSMALVADSFHMLSDVLALIIAFLSVKMSPKKWSKNTFGWARAEVLGALVNSVLYETEELHNPQMILIVGVIGLVINLIGLLLFHEHGHGHSHGGHGHSHGSHENKLSTINALVATDDNENDERFTPPPPNSLSSPEKGEDNNKSASQMNMRGVFLHILSDAMGSVIVIISALVVWLTEWEYSKYIDPALSLCLVTLITISTWPLLKVSALILLQTVPTHIQVDGIQKQLLNVDGVLAVHEFHVWQLAGERIIASAHIRCRNLKDYMVLAEKIKKMFHEEGIHSTTIQPEFVEFEDDGASASIDSAEDCILDCPSKDKDGCVANTCCGLSKQVKTDSKEELSFNGIKENGVSSPAFSELSLQQEIASNLPNASEASVPACSPQWIPRHVTFTASVGNGVGDSQKPQACTCTQISPVSAMESHFQVSPITRVSTSGDGRGTSNHCHDTTHIDNTCQLTETRDDTGEDKNGLQNICLHNSHNNHKTHTNSYASSVKVVIEDTESEDIPASVRL